MTTNQLVQLEADLNSLRQAILNLMTADYHDRGEAQKNCDGMIDDMLAVIGEQIGRQREMAKAPRTHWSETR